MPENSSKVVREQTQCVMLSSSMDVWQKLGQNETIDEFMNTDFTVRELEQFIEQFNQRNGTELSVGSSENSRCNNKGSFVLGAKIGIYQNIPGQL